MKPPLPLHLPLLFLTAFGPCACDEQNTPAPTPAATAPMQTATPLAPTPSPTPTQPMPAPAPVTGPAPTSPAEPTADLVNRQGINMIMDRHVPGLAPLPRQETVSIPAHTKTVTDPNGSQTCTEETHSVLEVFEGIGLWGAATASVFPGCAYTGTGLDRGQWELLPLERGPMDLVAVPAVPGGTVRVSSVSPATVSQAVAEIMKRVAAAGPLPARFSFKVEAVTSNEQIANETRVAGGFKTPLFAGKLGLESSDASSYRSKSFLVTMTQEIFSIVASDADIPDSAGFFSPKVKVAAVEDAVRQGVLGPGNSPSFVAVTVIGRKLVFRVTTESQMTNQAVKNTLEASYKAAAAGSLEDNSALANLLGSSRVEFLQLGGSTSTAQEAIHGRIEKFFGPIQPQEGVIIAVKLKDMFSSRQTTGLRSQFTYVVRDCFSCSESRKMLERDAYQPYRFSCNVDKFPIPQGCSFRTVHGGACSPGWTRGPLPIPVKLGGGGTCRAWYLPGSGPGDCRAQVSVTAGVTDGDTKCWLGPIVETAPDPDQPPLCQQ